MPHNKFIQANNLHFHVTEWGGSGPSIVLLHGLASQSHIWDLTAPYLIDQFSVIAIDQRGHGLSSKPDRGYDFQSVTADLDQILQQLHLDRSILIGHSWGGNVIVQFAAEHPDRTKGLVLVDGGFLEIPPEVSWEETERMLEPPDLIGMPYEEFRSNLKMWLGANWTPEAETIILNNFEVRDDKTIAPYMKKSNHMQVVRAIWEHKPSQLWAQIKCPVLIIPAMMPPQSDRDRAFAERKRNNVALAEKLLAHSQTVWMNNTIHDIPLQRPIDLANTIRDFALTL